MCLFIAIDSCTRSDQLSDDRLTIRLKWNQGFINEPYSNIETGLLWTLSFLGGEMKDGSLGKVIERVNDQYIDLKLFNAGFCNNAESKFAALIDHLKLSEEYRITGGIDVGRFAMYTLYSPYNYYAITNTERELKFFEQRSTGANQFRFAVTSSAVSSHERIIRFSPVSNALQMAFIAEDGQGSIEQNNFQTQTYECWTVMKNGQLRYAIYDTDGKLIGCSSSEAGKPGKCMWCHEIAVQQLYTINTDVSGFLSQTEFSAWISAYQSLLDNYRLSLNGEIDFSRIQDHTFAELLYITFMEPSVYRLANEWKLTETEVLERLAGISTHTNAEYPWMGNLYHRRDIESHSPFQSIPVSDDPRECSSYEPDYFGLHQ